MNPQLLTLFEEYDRSALPGASVMVARRGEAILARGFGLANLEEKISCGLETNFRLASVTKQFTAMAIMILAERQKLSLDDRLSRFFVEFPDYGADITIRHLLQHTSGLLDYEDLIPPETTVPVRDRDVLRLLQEQNKTYFAPDLRHRYSNSGYALLALIVEAQSKLSFAQFLEQNIFRPLAMHRTVAFEEGISTVHNRAYGYSPGVNGFERTDQSLTSSVLGDGGIYSTVCDLSRWNEALDARKLVSPAMLELAFASGPATEHPDTGYGFGWYIGRYRGLEEIWHSGNTIGFTTRVVRFPQEQFSIILLTNRNEADLAVLSRRIVDACLFG